MGLYYFYHKSPKQHQNLERSFVSLQQVPAFPTLVGGTRWVGHMVLAIETCLKSYKAIVNQLEDVAVQKVSKVNAAGKARGYIKLLKRPDVMGYIHVVLDVLKPLGILSSTLQSNQTTLADVDEKIQMTVAVLESYKDSPGPKAIVNQLEDVAVQKVSKVNAAGKARGYIKLLKRPDVMGYIHVVLDVLKPLGILSSTLQSNQTTLADVDEKIQMTVAVLESYKDSPGPMTRSYLGETKDQLFKGVKLSGSVDAPNLAKHRVSLTNNLIADAKAGVVEATRIANFHTWPVYDKKKDISKFGCEEVELITAHFKDVLVCANVNSNDALAKWDMLKSNLYSRYKVAVQKLLWTDVWQCYGDSYYNILCVVDLILCLPAQQRIREVFHK